METSAHDLNALFAQLGLDNSDDAIEAFLKNSRACLKSRCCMKPVSGHRHKRRF